MSKVELPACLLFLSSPSLPVAGGDHPQHALLPYPLPLPLPYLTSTLVLHLSIPPIPLFLHAMYAM